MSNFRSIIAKVTFTLKKHSPEIFAAAGVIGTVTAAVMACRATTKLDDILSETKDKLDSIHEFGGKDILGKPYSEERAKKDLCITYAQAGAKLIRLYAPSVMLGALSIGSLLCSNDILKKRNIALAAAYTSVDEGFKAYRNRVAERLGDEIEKEIRYNIKTVETEETSVDENGNTVTSVHTVKAADISPAHSVYARFFDEGSPYWEKDAEYNLCFLKSQQSYANDILKLNGYLYLNDVYKMLGIPETKAGQVVGWVYDKENPIGDNYVDFGIYDGFVANRDFVNGYERTILLDFNVDGNIWTLMEENDGLDRKGTGVPERDMFDFDNP
ncbi:MAG: DUF6353 family protein [Ruminococcus sp.]|nr:DUF6353 family protein [Ruminococcus sp.]